MNTCNSTMIKRNACKLKSLKCVIVEVIIFSYIGIASAGNDEKLSLNKYAVEQVKAAKIAAPMDSFIPEGYVLRDTASGDLNGDSIVDKLLLIDHLSSPGTSHGYFESRPLRILYGAGGGRYTIGPVNDKLVLCKMCGDTLSDPYSGMSIKGGSFSVLQKGRYKIFWNRTITFKFVDSTWILQKDAIKSREQGNHNAPTYTTTRTKKDFGTISFEAFDIYNADEYIKTIDSSKIFPVASGSSTQVYTNWQIVKGGIWKVLDYCTGKITPAYITFIKVEDSDSDLGIMWQMYINLKRSRDCEAIAFKNASYITTDSISLASFNKKDSVYILGKDTLALKFVPGPVSGDYGGRSPLLIAIRNGKEQLLTKDLGMESSFYVEYASDINRDGFIDAGIKILDRYERNIVYLSTLEKDGTVTMVEAGRMTFTD